MEKGGPKATASRTHPSVVERCSMTGCTKAVANLAMAIECLVMTIV